MSDKQQGDLGALLGYLHTDSDLWRLCPPGRSPGAEQAGRTLNVENDSLWKQTIHYWQNRPTTLQNVILRVFTAAREAKSHKAWHRKKDCECAELNLLWRWSAGWLDEVLHNLLSRCESWDKTWEIKQGLCTEGFPMRDPPALAISPVVWCRNSNSCVSWWGFLA